jgi:hypothetical protein
MHPLDLLGLLAIRAIHEPQRMPARSSAGSEGVVTAVDDEIDQTLDQYPDGIHPDGIHPAGRRMPSVDRHFISYARNGIVGSEVASYRPCSLLS